jgi:RNA polymerase sigma-70 factor (ECF subfamily)
MPLDPLKLASLIDAHAAALELWVRRRCASPEDVVQEAFCRLAAQEPCPDNAVAWLYRVCRNLAERQRLSDVRRRQREASQARTEVASDSPVDTLVAAETVLAVQELEDDLRQVLVARIWGQLPFEEIGNLCGISTATAFRRYDAALKVLREKLESKSEHRS